jgi:hypothetical protein
MSIENIVESSCKIIGNYFLNEQHKRDNENKNKMLDQITKNIKNEIIKELNGVEIFTPNYKKEYFQSIKDIFISLITGRSYYLQRNNDNGRVNSSTSNVLIRYKTAEELFNSYFTKILNKLKTDEYIIGLYGDIEDYIIAFTNRLNIIKYYNEKGPIKMNKPSSWVSPWWVDGRGLRTNTVVLGLTIENNDLLLNDLQIDLINRMFNKISFSGRIYSTEIPKGMLEIPEEVLKRRPVKGKYMVTKNMKQIQMHFADIWGYNLPDYYGYYTNIVKHIVYMFKTYWTGKFLSPFAKKIELENKRLVEIHSKIYNETIYKQQKEELDKKIQECNAKIKFLEITTIKEKEVTEKLNKLEILQKILKEKHEKIREIQNKNKEMLDDIKKREEIIEKEKSKISNENNLIKDERIKLQKDKEHFEKYKQFLLEHDI